MSIHSDHNEFVNAVREVLGLAPLPYTSKELERQEYAFTAHALRGLWDGNRRRYAKVPSDETSPLYIAWHR